MDSKDASAPSLLFSEEDMALEKVGSPVFTGASTGERLLSQRPDLYRITVQLLGQGTGIREIKRLTGLHHRTIEAVMIREGSTIDTHRKELGARALKVAAMGVERLEEIITDGAIKPGELSMAVGILIDKGQVLTGGVTARVEKVEQSQVAAGLERMLDDLPVIDAELVEDAPQINLSGENASAIAALPAPDPAATIAQVDADPVCEIEPVQFDIHAPSDGQSDASPVSISVESGTATSPATPQQASDVTMAPGANPPASTSTRSKEGGRGSAPRPRAKNRD